MKVFIYYILVCLLFVNCFLCLDVYITPEESSKLLGEFIIVVVVVVVYM